MKRPNIIEVFKAYYTVDNDGSNMTELDFVGRKRLYGWCKAGHKLYKVRSYYKNGNFYGRDYSYCHCCPVCQKKFKFIIQSYDY